MPRGKFQDKTLKDCLDELPFRDVKELIFTIEGPGIKIVKRIHRDDGDGFESMKRYIAPGGGRVR